MRYYTKEWYNLMQRCDDAEGWRKIADKSYTGAEIREFYEKALKRRIAEDRREYNTPPCFLDVDERLSEENFQPDDWILVEEESGTARKAASPEEVKASLAAQRRKAEEAFANRPPFDSAESAALFREEYRTGLRCLASRYPAWLLETVDRRLLALRLLPESAYKRLRAETAANRRAFRKIERAAERELSRQDIPASIRDNFCLHDGDVLSLKKKRRDYEMLLRTGGIMEAGTPYVKVIFKDTRWLDREDGLLFRQRRNPGDGTLESNCQFLDQELYRKADGDYEVHMLLYTTGGLKYLTVCCRDIQFVWNMDPGTGVPDYAETWKQLEQLGIAGPFFAARRLNDKERDRPLIRKNEC